jgi:hypothetical protein
MGGKVRIRERLLACHLLGHTATHLITEIKKRKARLVIGWVTAQMISMPGAVRRCIRFLWPVKASDKTPRGVIPPVCVKYCRTPQKKKLYPQFCCDTLRFPSNHMHRARPQAANHAIPASFHNTLHSASIFVYSNFHLCPNTIFYCLLRPSTVT